MERCDTRTPRSLLPCAAFKRGAERGFGTKRLLQGQRGRQRAFLLSLLFSPLFFSPLFFMFYLTLPFPTSTSPWHRQPPGKPQGVQCKPRRLFPMADQPGAPLMYLSCSSISSFHEGRVLRLVIQNPCRRFIFPCLFALSFNVQGSKPVICTFLQIICKG